MIKQNEQDKRIRQSEYIKQNKPKDVLHEDIIKQIVSLYCYELKVKQIESERIFSFKRKASPKERSMIDTYGTDKTN